MRVYPSSPTRRTSKSLSAMRRMRTRFSRLLKGNSETKVDALLYSSSLKLLIRTPGASLSKSESESPIPALIIKGKPQARYSAYFVGDEASFEKQGLINASPASLIDRYDGTSRGSAAKTV